MIDLINKKLATFETYVFKDIRKAEYILIAFVVKRIITRMI